MSNWMLRECVNGWMLHKEQLSHVYIDKAWIAQTPEDAAKIITAQENLEKNLPDK